MKLLFSLTILSTISSSLLDLDCLIFFGDSLSDPGNLYKLMLGIYPDNRYYKGRFSNGPVWSEYFVNNIKPKRIDNLAFGGATTRNDYNSMSKLVPSLDNQLMLFMLKGKSCYINNTPKHLVSYMAGVNNYLNPNVTVEATISDIRRHLEILIKDLGFRNIFITDIPPINEAPIFTGSHLKPGEDRGNVRNDPNIKSKVDKHNLLMKYLISSTRSQYPRVNLYFYQFSSIWSPAQALNPFRSPDWNTKDPCFDTSLQGCLKPHDYFFFDIAHPITEIHEFLAKDIAGFLTNNWRP